MSGTGQLVKEAKADPDATAVLTKKRLSGPNKSRPQFVSKMWDMVNNPANHEFIRWMPDGRAIQIVNRDAFEKVILPKYFKHNNLSSFVRQLNMYGWHKVQDLSSGTMNSNEENWQFQSPYFIRGHEELLDHIVRNLRNKSQRHEEESDSGAPGLSQVLCELEQIKKRQINIGEDLSRMRQDNQLLWAEYYQTRERFDKHSQMLARILRFMASMYGGQPSKMMSPGADGGSRRLVPNGDRALTAPPPGPSAEQEQELQELQDQIQEIRDFSDASPASNSPGATLENALVPTHFSQAPPRAHPRSRIQIPQSTSSAAGQQLIKSRLQNQGLSQDQVSNGVSLETASRLFPELTATDLANAASASDAGVTAPTLAPPMISEHELENISHEIANNGNSLQQIQDWLNRKTPNFDSHWAADNNGFNMDDFLVDGGNNGEVSEILPDPLDEHGSVVPLTPGKGEAAGDHEQPDLKRKRTG